MHDDIDIRPIGRRDTVADVLDIIRIRSTIRTIRDATDQINRRQGIYRVGVPRQHVIDLIENDEVDSAAGR